MIKKCACLEGQMVTTYIDDGLCAALVAYKPHIEGHTVVMPYRHVSSIDELTEKELISCTNTIARAKKTLNLMYGYNSFSMIINEGYPVQDVNHFHWHIIPIVADSDYATHYAQIENHAVPSQDIKLVAKQLRELESKTPDE